MKVLILDDMKTNVIMMRPMGQFEVQQRTSDGYFDANALLMQWNKQKGVAVRKMAEYLESKKTKEFIEALENDSSLRGENESGGFKAVIRIKGKTTKDGRVADKVFLHPFCFIDFSMWLNPTFKLQVIKFVYDELIKNRHLAGDNYNVLTAALAAMPDVDYKKVATAIQWIVFNRTGKNLRQQATQEQLSEISDIESKLAYAINMGFIKSYDELIITMRKMYNDKYQKF